MKKWTVYLPAMIIMIMLFGFSMSVRAAETAIDDQASLLTSENIDQLQQMIVPIEQKAKAHVFIVTNSDNKIDSTRFADYYMLDRIGKNNNGITFYIDMKQRKFIISTSGNMIDYMTDSRIEQTLDEIEPSMRSGNYFQAIESFLKNTDHYFEQGIPGGHYRIDTETGKIIHYKVLTSIEIIIAFSVATIIGILFFVFNLFKYQLKIGTYNYPFREKAQLHLTQRKDTLTNSFVTTRHIPKNNSNGGGSSTHSTGGGSFGGGGRSF